MSLSGINLSVGGKGMKGFYGSITDGTLGIVGNVAKSLFKQEPKTVEIPQGTPMLRADAILRYHRGEITLREYGKLEEAYQQSLSVQHSINITPELIESVKEGLPMFMVGGELEKGIRTEMEHRATINKFKRAGISTREVAKSIAKDHIEEDSLYYTKLNKIEK
jgi:hypothetical protein